MPLLEQRHRLADAYYFIAHDYMVGKRRLHPNVTGIGLGGALLGELVFTGSVTVEDGNIYLLSQRPPADPLVHDVLADMRSQPQHRDLQTWLSFLSVTALVKVTDRLRMNRLLTEVERRRIVGTRKVLVPTDLNDASWQAIRLERLLNTNTQMNQIDGFLAGLVSVTGLMQHVLWDPDTNRPGYDFLPYVINALHPALLAIVKQAEAAVGQSVLAPR